MPARPFASLWIPVLALLALVLATGCRHEEALPQLLNVVDVGPRTVGAGDTLEITGSGFPAKRMARVTFVGTLLRPGQEPEEGATIDAEGVAASPSKIELAVSEALVEQLCGKNDAATHTTFRGVVEVSFPAATPGAMPITGTVHDVVLDTRPLVRKRATRDAQVEEGKRVLALLGLSVGDEPASGGGLVVVSVAEESAAEAAGLAKGDVLATLDGWNVLDAADVIPSGRRRFSTFGVLRPGEGVRFERQVAIQGYRPRGSSDLLGVALVLGTAAAIVFFLASPLSRGLTWIERWTASRPAARRGRAVLVWLSDCLVALLRGGSAGDPLAEVLPFVLFLSVSALVASVPFGRALVGVDVDAGMLFVLSVVMGLATALSSGRHPGTGKWAFVRSLRLGGWMLCYQVAAAGAAMCVLAHAGAFGLPDVVRAQGGEPWHWLVFRSPAGAPLLALFVLPSVLDLGASPAKLPDAAPETSLEPPRRTTSASLGWAGVLIASALASTLWLGGWALPLVDRATQERSLVLSLLGAVLLLGKTWVLSLVIAVARETLPRPSLDQSTSTLLRIVLPTSLLCFAATAGFLLLDPAPMVRRVLATVACGLLTVLFVHVVRRLAAAVRGAGAQPQVSPFL